MFSDGGSQMLDLIGAANIDFRFQIPRLDLIHRPFQLLDRCRDPRGDIGVDDRKQ